MSTIRWRGPLCAALLLFTAPSSALAAWLRAESPRFIAYSNGSEKALREDVEVLETFDTLMRKMHGRDERGVPPRKLVIYLVSRPSELNRISPKMRGVLGFYSSRGDSVFATSIRQRGVGTTLLHEYAHHFMLQYFPFAYPSWAVEGYAEYFMTATKSRRGMEVGRPNYNRGAWLLEGNWLPLEDVVSKRPGELKNLEQVAMYYSQSWLLTHYFHSAPDRYAMLQAYLRAVGGGTDPVEAMEESTGRSIDQLQKDVRDYARGGLPYLIIPLEEAAAPPIRVSTLSPAADDLLLEMERLRSGSCDEKLLALVRQVAARYPDDALVQLALARAERISGDAAAAQAALTKRLSADPADVEALEISADVLMEKGDEADDDEERIRLYREAGELLVRSNRAQNDRFQTLYRFARARSVEPDYPSDNVLDGLLAAYEYAPQVPTVAVLTAQVLAAKGQKPRAIRILTRLANDPHGGEAAAYFRDLIKSIETGGPPPAPPVFAEEDEES